MKPNSFKNKINSSQSSSSIISKSKKKEISCKTIDMHQIKTKREKYESYQTIPKKLFKKFIY